MFFPVEVELTLISQSSKRFPKLHQYQLTSSHIESVCFINLNHFRCVKSTWTDVTHGFGDWFRILNPEVLWHSTERHWATQGVTDRRTRIEVLLESHCSLHGCFALVLLESQSFTPQSFVDYWKANFLGRLPNDRLITILSEPPLDTFNREIWDRMWMRLPWSIRSFSSFRTSLFSLWNM
jgi:hypothetical protein